MRAKICWQDLDSFDFPIQLVQSGVDDFTVTDGKEINTHLSYGEAAKHLGQAVMHALACQGKLDNR